MRSLLVRLRYIFHWHHFTVAWLDSTRFLPSIGLVMMCSCGAVYYSIEKPREDNNGSANQVAANS